MCTFSPSNIIRVRHDDVRSAFHYVDVINEEEDIVHYLFSRKELQKTGDLYTVESFVSRGTHFHLCHGKTYPSIQKMGESDLP